MLLAALPLADEPGADIEVASEHGLACSFLFPQRPNFRRRQRPYRGQAHLAYSQSGDGGPLTVDTSEELGRTQNAIPGSINLCVRAGLRL